MPHTPANPTLEWRRRYLHSVWRLRRQERLHAFTTKKMTKTQLRLQRDISQLKNDLRRATKGLRAQELTISAQQNVLGQYKLPSYSSFRLCTARQDEVCPLSLGNIETSTLPFAPDTVYNPSQPQHTCAELACGHRFSSMWLLYHFVKNSTFRCPVCMTGIKHFSFRMADFPEHLRPIFQHA